MVLSLPDSWSNWNLEVLVFDERGKLEYSKKNLLEQRREPRTNSTHIWCWCWDLNLGHIGGRLALSPLCHPLLPQGFIRCWVSIQGFQEEILVVGESCNVTGEYFERGSTSEYNSHIGYWMLAGEFCVVHGELSDFRCLMNALLLLRLWNCKILQNTTTAILKFVLDPK